MILPPKKDDSCVLWFDFASVKNNTVYDQSKYHNDGTIYGAQHIGRFGLHGLSFDGVDDYVHIDEKLKTQGNDFTIIVFSENEENDGYSLLFGSGGTERSPMIYYVIEPGGYYYQIGFDDTESNWRSRNVWLSKYKVLGRHFIAFSYTPGLMRFYVDDIKKEWTDFNYNILQDTPYKFIGRGEGGAYVKGNIYFVALYNRALSDAEIRELYYYLTKGIRSIVPSRFVARATR